MKTVFLIIVIALSSPIFAQSEMEENELWIKYNSYLQAIKDDNRFELPTSEERKAVKKDKNLKEYASLKANEVLQVLAKNYPNSKNWSPYFYNKGMIEYDEAMFEECKISLSKVTENNDSHIDYNFLNANLILAKIALDEKKYEEGLEYLKNMQLHYKRKQEEIQNRKTPICGNEFINNKKFKFLFDCQSLYESCLAGINNK